MRGPLPPGEVTPSWAGPPPPARRLQEHGAAGAGGGGKGPFGDLRPHGAGAQVGLPGPQGSGAPQPGGCAAPARPGGRGQPPQRHPGRPLGHYTLAGAPGGSAAGRAEEPPLPSESRQEGDGGSAAAALAHRPGDRPAWPRRRLPAGCGRSLLQPHGLAGPMRAPLRALPSAAARGGQARRSCEGRGGQGKGGESGRLPPALPAPAQVPSAGPPASSCPAGRLQPGTEAAPRSPAWSGAPRPPRRTPETRAPDLAAPEPSGPLAAGGGPCRPGALGSVSATGVGGSSITAASRQKPLAPVPRSRVAGTGGGGGGSDAAGRVRGLCCTPSARPRRPGWPPPGRGAGAGRRGGPSRGLRAHGACGDAALMPTGGSVDRQTARPGPAEAAGSPPPLPGHFCALTLCRGGGSRGRRKPPAGRAREPEAASPAERGRSRPRPAPGPAPCSRTRGAPGRARGSARSPRGADPRRLPRLNSA